MCCCTECYQNHHSGKGVKKTLLVQRHVTALTLYSHLYVHGGRFVEGGGKGRKGRERTGRGGNGQEGEGGDGPDGGPLRDKGVEMGGEEGKGRRNGEGGKGRRRTGKGVL